MSTTISASSIKNIYQSHALTAKKLKNTSYKDRIKKIDAIIDYLSEQKNEDKLIQAMYVDMKKPKVEVMVSELAVIFSIAKYIKRNLKEWVQDKSVSTSLSLAGATSYIIKEPKGSALIISPWNYPFQLAIAPLCYAIAAGNTAVIKPSEYSKATSNYIKEMIGEIFDPSEITVVEGAVEETQMLLDQPWNHIYFTGSPAVGKIIMKAAAEHLSSITLELGGKSPCIIDNTADIPSTASKLTWAKYLNNGQTCIAPDYVLVDFQKEKELISEIKSAINQQLNSNDNGIKESPDYGRIISDKHYSKCIEVLQDAISKGAKVEIGGEYDANSRFISPTVLSHISDDMTIMQEEIFGPILPILTYKNKEEVTQIIANKPKPLALYIQSKEQSTIDYHLQHTTAGGTVINDFMIHYANPNLPFGGVNNSGIGKSHGYYGFQEFTNERAVMRQKLGATSLLHPPYTKRSERLAAVMGKWLS